MFKGGSIKPIVIALLAISAIMISFSFPYIVFAYENYMLEGYGIHYEADPVRINSESVSFTEKLRDMTTAIDNSSYVYIGDENTYDTELNLTKDTAFVASADAFMDLFISDDMLMVLGTDRQTLKTELFNSSDVNASKYLIIRPGSRDMYLAWIVEIKNEYGDMELIIDDESAKLLSAYVSVYPDTKIDGLFSDNFFNESFGDRVANYYEMNYIASEYSASKNSVNSVGTSSTSVRSIKLMGADPDEEVVLPYVIEQFYDGAQLLYFNFFSYSSLNLDPMESDIYVNSYNETDIDNSDEVDAGNNSSNPKTDPSGNTNNQGPYNDDGAYAPDDPDSEPGNGENKLDKGTPTDADKKDD